VVALYDNGELSPVVGSFKLNTYDNTIIAFHVARQ
jgi:hypothetical protein